MTPTNETLHVILINLNYNKFLSGYQRFENHKLFTAELFGVPSVLILRLGQCVDARKILKLEKLIIQRRHRMS